MTRPRPKGVSVVVPLDKVQEIASSTALEDYLKSVFQVLDKIKRP